MEKIKGKLTKKWGTGTVVIPAPIEVDEIMKKVPKGKLITINQIREILAKKHHATIGCLITTGIFAWISAYATEEEKATGKKETRRPSPAAQDAGGLVTPWWRTLKAGGMLNEKYPGGAENQKKLLEQEDHQIIQKGKNYFVANWEKSLFTGS